MPASSMTRGVEARDLLGDEDALLEAAVRELQAGDDVADGVDAGHVGAQAVVGEDEAAVHRDADLLEADARGVRAAADGDEQEVGLERLAVLERAR